MMDNNSEQRRLESGSNFFRRLIHRQVGEGAVSKGEKSLSNSPGRCSNTSEADTHLEGVVGNRRISENSLVGSEEYVRDESSLLSLQPWIFKKKLCQYVGDKNEDGDFPDSFGHDSSEAEFSPRNVSLGYGHGSSRKSLRSRRSRRFSVKPLNSVDSCLIPPLYSEQFEIEDHVFNSFPPSTKPCIRPFFITDGNKIISKSSFDPFGMPLGNGFHEEVDLNSSRTTGGLIGVPPLIGSLKYKRKSREPEQEESALHHQRSNNQPQKQGSPARMLLFTLGIAVGMMSNFLRNRKEVKKLKELLKQTENLVQDLQEELEMKTSFTVKELDYESTENQEHNDKDTNRKESLQLFQNQLSQSIDLMQKANEDVKLPIAKAIQKSESMIKIEAELEAELEKLDLNMTSSNLQELDPDLIAEVVHGELREDTLHQGAQKGQDDSQTDNSSTSTTDLHDVNYAVSPRELSLRLHEVIQSRLEERIKEVERALHQSQKQLESVKAEQAISQRAFSSSEMGSSSNQESPTLGRDDNISSLPLCFKLTGDALNAYDEVYEEFARLSDFDEENLASVNTFDQKHDDSVCPANRSLIWGMKDGVTNKSSSANSFGREQKWEDVFDRKADNTGENCRDDVYDTNDEEKRLIQQILQRTRQGSSAIALAQKMLFSLDE